MIKLQLQLSKDKDIKNWYGHTSYNPVHDTSIQTITWKIINMQQKQREKSKQPAMEYSVWEAISSHPPRAWTLALGTWAVTTTLEWEKLNQQSTINILSASSLFTNPLCTLESPPRHWSEPNWSEKEVVLQEYCFINHLIRKESCQNVWSWGKTATNSWVNIYMYIFVPNVS